MKNQNKIMRTGLLIFLCVLIIAGTAVLFISQMNKMIESNTMNTITELAEHDRVSIQNFVEMKWYELQNIQTRFESYGCNTISDVQQRMNQERASSDFHSLYLVAEDGTVYTDRYMSYPPGEADILQYLGQEGERIVRRFDYKETASSQRETLLYAIPLKDYVVEGTRFTAFAGVTNIKEIQDKIMIHSFQQNGVNRGYSSVVNPSGDYIVNIEKTVSLYQNSNLYELLDKGTVGAEWTREAIVGKMGNQETFYFYYTDKDGVEKLLYFMPIENTPWYFLSMVEKSVFTKQSRAFTLLSMAMLVAVMFTVIFILLFFMASQNKVVKANAEAKARSDFLSNMSHEIRTPLNGVIGLLHLMQTHVKDGNSEQMSEWIDKAHATANYLLSLVSDILDMSKLQAGKLELAPGPFMVDSMIGEIWTMQHSNIESHGVTFIVDKDIPIPCVIGDEIRIKQVLMNIIGNAAKFTPEGGMIKLSVSQKQTDEQHVDTIMVCEDTGIGMSSQFLETIWDSFSQEHNTKTSKIRGTGLGMALCKRFVDAMGGEITVSSELGVGSVFTVVLHTEIAQMLPIGAGEGVEEADTFEEGGSFKLLVAEDNELNAEILTEILKDAGFEVVLAENGQEAVEKFSLSEPGEFKVILMDMQMPIMDGCQASRKIRQLNRPDAGSIPIFACTANTFQEDKDKALESGMSDFLIKPIDVNILLMKMGKGKK